MFFKSWVPEVGTVSRVSTSIFPIKHNAQTVFRQEQTPVFQTGVPACGVHPDKMITWNVDSDRELFFPAVRQNNSHPVFQQKGVASDLRFVNHIAQRAVETSRQQDVGETFAQCIDLAQIFLVMRRLRDCFPASIASWIE